MKKLFLIFVLFVLPISASAESILRFDSVIRVNKDATLNITETIVYDFGARQSHGLFRDIPYEYKNSSGKYNLRIDVLGVNDDLGSALKYETSTENGSIKIKIGDPSVIVSGQKTYKITYSVRRAMTYFDDHDEVYWNVTGNGWQVPIQFVSANVVSPSTPIEAVCYADYLGSSHPCSRATKTGSEAQFRQGKLEPGMGLTIAVSFAKDAIAEPGTFERLVNLVRDNLIYLLPLISLLLMFLLWFFRGRDPLSKLPVVAQYEPSEGITPAEAGYIIHEGWRKQFVAAEFVNLAVKGYIKISREPTKNFIGFQKEDYRLTKLKGSEGLDDPFEKNIIDNVFSSESLTISFLKKAGVAKDSFGASRVVDRLKGLDLIAHNPNTVRIGFFALAGVVFWLGTVVSGYPLLGALCAIPVVGFGYFMPVRTPKGADIRQHIRGLKMYMQVAEKDRMDFHFDPTKDPERFEKLLPYAIALGVNEQWSKKFEGIYENRQPGWYYDPSMTAFSAINLNSSLNRFSGNVGGMLVASGAVGNGAAGGGSGFNGGFSGGGFGGGGGGSW